MALQERLVGEIPIIQKTICLYVEFYESLKGFPKKDQYMLGKHAQDALLLFLEYIMSTFILYQAGRLRLLPHWLHEISCTMLSSNNILSSISASVYPRSTGSEDKKGESSIFLQDLCLSASSN